MVFGVFDLLHPGHLYLLYHARLEGRELVVVVARDAATRRLKGAAPEWSERERVRAVRETGLATKVILGDAGKGDYSVVRKHKPDVICLGYDQDLLKKDLLANMKAGRLPKIPLRTLRPYKPVLFHTSLRRGGK